MSDDLDPPEDVNAVIREQRRRTTVNTTLTNGSYPEGIMLPNSVVLNQELNAERRGTVISTVSAEDEASYTSSRRGSYWDSQLVENIRNTLQKSEKQSDSDDLSESHKNLFRRNKIRTSSLESNRRFSQAELTEQELRRLKRAQRRTQAIPIITELRRATQESLRVAMELSEDMDLTDDAITNDMCIDTHHKHKHHDDSHKHDDHTYTHHHGTHKNHINTIKSRFNSHAHHDHKIHHVEDDKVSQHRIGFKKSEAKVNMHFHIHEEKHTDLRRQPLQGLRSKSVVAASLKDSTKQMESNEDLNM